MEVVKNITIISTKSNRIDFNIAPLDSIYDYITVICDRLNKDVSNVYLFNKTAMSCSSLSPATNYSMLFYTNREEFNTQKSNNFHVQTGKIIKEKKIEQGVSA